MVGSNSIMVAGNYLITNHKFRICDLPYYILILSSIAILIFLYVLIFAAGELKQEKNEKLY